MRYKISVILLVYMVVFGISGCSGAPLNDTQTDKPKDDIQLTIDDSEISEDTAIPADLPDYSGTSYVELNNNIPNFDKAEMVQESFERYSELDALGRPGIAYANIGTDLMPTEPRGEIGQIKPAGWHTVKYDCVDGMYLYNRCHLIGYQLTGENDNVNNLMTGTRYLNVQGMLFFENMVADYITTSGNHVLYRVTPIYEGNNLVADGVQMEGYSVEDSGAGICYNVFCYNVQPGIIIDYKNGESYEESEGTIGENESKGTEGTVGGTESEGTEDTAGGMEGEGTEGIGNVVGSDQNKTDYVLNKNTHKFHYPGCSSVKEMNENNKWHYNGTKEEVEALGYEPCGRCKP